MLPLRDLNPTRHKPVLMYGLLAANMLVFVADPSQGPAREDFVHRFGLVPYALLYEGHPGSWVTPLSYMFLHGDLFHLLSNMWFLYVFGDNVEDLMGRGRFLLFYLACGLAAALGQTLRDPSSYVPMVGASGAIAGTLGAYVRLFPGARVVTWMPPFFFTFELPASFFIFVWFGKELVHGYVSLTGNGMSGIAFFAHIGGFLAGLGLVRVIGPKHNPEEGWVSPRKRRPNLPPREFNWDP